MMNDVVEHERVWFASTGLRTLDIKCTASHILVLSHRGQGSEGGFTLLNSI
jgi:hypothetical protein